MYVCCCATHLQEGVSRHLERLNSEFEDISQTHLQDVQDHQLHILSITGHLLQHPMQYQTNCANLRTNIKYGTLV